MAVDVLMIVTARQLSELPGEALAAGVVLARGTPAIASPVAERSGDPLEAATARQYGASFTHGQMMRRIKALCRQMAERPGLSSSVACSQGIAVVFDQVEIV